jgi:hypothetical protein
MWIQGMVIIAKFVTAKDCTKKNKRGVHLMFSTGMILAAGGTIAIALVDKALEETGFYWLGTILKLAVPLAGVALGVWFLQNNPMNGWLGL